MTGRARGRSRGRGRGGGGEAARRPGEGAQQAAPEQVAPVGRGRASRGPPPGQQVPQQQQQRPVAPPTEAMAGMSVKEEQRPPVQTASGDGEQRPPRRSRDVPDDIATKPAHIVDIKGAHGATIKLITNHFKLKTKTNFGVYQYNVSFNPEMESKKKLINEKECQSPRSGELVTKVGGMLGGKLLL